MVSAEDPGSLVDVRIRVVRRVWGEHGRGDVGQPYRLDVRVDGAGAGAGDDVDVVLLRLGRPAHVVCGDRCAAGASSVADGVSAAEIVYDVRGKHDPPGGYDVRQICQKHRKRHTVDAAKDIQEIHINQ